MTASHRDRMLQGSRYLPVLLLLSLAGKAAAVAIFHAQGAFLLVALCFSGPDLLILYHLFAPSAQGLCRVVTRFATPGREIWLTIDDGPDPEDTPRILDLLDRHGARATFFLVGERAESSPALVAEILRRGHQVGHHTHTHPMKWFWCEGPRGLGVELDRALATLRAAGADPRWFRSPVGIKNLLLGRALHLRGLTFVGWSVRSYDARSRDPAAVRDGVMRRVRPGSIVLMHEGPWMDARVRVTAIALVLDALADRQLTCVLPAPAQLR